MRREVIAEQPDVAVVCGPGQQTGHHGVGDVDFASPLDVLEVAVETDEGGQAEAGFGDALDDVGRFGGWEGTHSSEMSSARRRSWEMVMGVPLAGSFYMDGQDWGFGWDGVVGWGNFAKSRSFPLISTDLSREGRGWWG